MDDATPELLDAALRAGASVNLSTARLELRPLRAEDFAAAHALWTSEHVRRFLFDDRELSLDEVRAFFAASEASFHELGYGIWLVQEKATGALVGFAGFLRSETAPNLVYGIRAESVGRGYATEAAEAVLHHAMKTLRLPKVVADVDEPNAASVRVLARLGMTRAGRTIVRGRVLLNFVRSA